MYQTLGMCDFFLYMRFVDPKFFPKLPLGFRNIILRALFVGEVGCTITLKSALKLYLKAT